MNFKKIMSATLAIAMSLSLVSYAKADSGNTTNAAIWYVSDPMLNSESATYTFLASNNAAMTDSGQLVITFTGIAGGVHPGGWATSNTYVDFSNNLSIDYDNASVSQITTSGDGVSTDWVITITFGITDGDDSGATADFEANRLITVQIVNQHNPTGTTNVQVEPEAKFNHGAGDEHSTSNGFGNRMFVNQTTTHDIAVLPSATLDFNNSAVSNSQGGFTGDTDMHYVLYPSDSLESTVDTNAQNLTLYTNAQGWELHLYISTAVALGTDGTADGSNLLGTTTTANDATTLSITSAQSSAGWGATGTTGSSPVPATFDAGDNGFGVHIEEDGGNATEYPTAQGANQYVAMSDSATESSSLIFSGATATGDTPVTATITFAALADWSVEADTYTLVTKYNFVPDYTN